jgi:CheY-like chemotaxis protein
MKHPHSFIIVDDDSLHNSLCKLVIKSATNKTDILDFIYPEEALEFLKKNSNDINDNTILLLDINMPRLDGWAFLKEYDLFNERLREKIAVYILSSSINEADKEKAFANPHVQDYIMKPLSIEDVKSLTKSV